jgi:hypothetical protein
MRKNQTTPPSAVGICKFVTGLPPDLDGGRVERLLPLGGGVEYDGAEDVDDLTAFGH